jgi:3-methylcrotonyl-CoA carboxylase alpha subunit
MARRTFGIMMDGDERSLKLDDYQPPAEDGLGRIGAEIDGRTVEASFRILSPNRIRLLIDGRDLTVHLSEAAGIRYLAADGAQAACQATRSRRAVGPKQARGPEVCPPMPSVVVRVLVEVGQTVKAGEAVAVVSAMKMESTLTAPFDGIVEAVLAAEGDQVGPDDVLVRVRPQEEDQ